jgi:hypothetical protein
MMIAAERGLGLSRMERKSSRDKAIDDGDAHVADQTTIRPAHLNGHVLPDREAGLRQPLAAEMQ